MTHLLVATALRWAAAAFDPKRSDEERRKRCWEIFELLGELGNEDNGPE